MVYFLTTFKNYFIEMLPALIIGFFISGIIHELISDSWINKHLGGKGVKGVFWATFVGALIPLYAAGDVCLLL